MEKAQVIPGLSDMVFYFRSSKVLALLNQALIKPHLQHLSTVSRNMRPNCEKQTVKGEKEKVPLRRINRRESLPLQKKAETLACLTCQKGGYREKGIVLEYICAMPEEDKLNLR